MASLMTLRLNIYTDPQKPIQVEPKVYADRRAEARFPGVRDHQLLAHLLHRLRRDREQRHQRLAGRPRVRGHERADRLGGRQVLRRHASRKFIKEIGFEQQVTRRELVIPGYVAQISGELEENLPGWKVLVGPQEAGDLESFVKSRLK